MSIRHSLNEQQQRAVETIEGPLIIAAGPGTGKTGTIVRRIVFLIEENNISPANILAVSFTNKAAKELKNRITKTTSQNISSLSTGTFHTLCASILRKEIERLSFGKDFVIFNEKDRINFITRILADKALRHLHGSPATFSSHLSQIKNMVAKQEDYEEVPCFFEHYQKRLQENNALDFDDLILKTLELFTSHPDLLKKYQDRFHYIMVDEYQDINTPQYHLIRHLTGKRNNLCVIGDADQAIYSFRGANVQSFLNFQHDYPDAAIIKLEQNYRSTPTIIDAATQIIERNSGRLGTKIQAAGKAARSANITVITAADEKDEAKKITSEIEQLMGGISFTTMNMAEGGEGVDQQIRCFSDCVVLYRLHTQSRVLKEAFIRSGIPCQVVGGTSFYEQKEIKDIIAYLRVIKNEDDDTSLLRIINTPSRKIGEQTVMDALHHAESKKISLFHSFSLVVDTDFFNNQQKEAIKTFLTLLKRFQEYARKQTVDSLIKYLIAETKIDQYYKKEEKIESFTMLNASLVKFQHLSPSESLDKFLEEAALSSAIDGFDPRAKAVTLMTMHAAKGLEFPVVFICGVENGLIPYSKASEDEEEERRLFYVGMTRAKHRLYFLHAKKRFLYGKTQSNPLSPFVSSISSCLTDRIDYSTSNKKKKKDAQLCLFQEGEGTKEHKKKWRDDNENMSLLR